MVDDKKEKKKNMDTCQTIYCCQEANQITSAPARCITDERGGGVQLKLCATPRHLFKGKGEKHCPAHSSAIVQNFTPIGIT